MYADKINPAPPAPSSPRKPQITLRALAILALASGAGATSLRALSAPAEKPNSPAKADVMKSAAAKPLTKDEKIVHVLNRLGFGPRPGDVQKVKAMGLQAYINQQLSPETINDSAVDQQLAAYTQLSLSDEQLMGLYQARQQAFAASRKLRKAIIGENTQKNAAANPIMTPGANPAMTPGAAAGVTVDAAGGANPIMTDTTGADAPDKKGKGKKSILAQADPQERQEAQAARRALAQASLPVALAQKQFVDAKALRAIESERQLQEVLVDFWSNHFNIDVRKQSCGVLKIADDREVIRPHILGKFRDLLGASAHSPAMLVYLDNALSTSDTPPDMNAMRAAMNGMGGQGGRVNRMGRAGMMRRRLALMGGVGANGQAPNAQASAAPAKKKRGGLNENYGREIMELHTLGVDGGYTQADVTEVARCFTGWSIGRQAPAMGAGMANNMRMRQRLAGGKKGGVGAFEFHPFLHDNGAKTVLGHQIPAGGGIQDGETVLDILASHPATMQHISTQLCQRLVSDTPPASLVDKCVQAWKRTDGDLREITRTIITSPEFYATAAFRSKIKSPFEFAVSSVRALGGTYASAVENGAMRGKGAKMAGQLAGIKPPKGGGYLYMNTNSLVGEVGTMGQPLFQYQAPTGYPEESQKWVSSGALISRMNFALALTGGKLGDVSLPASSPALTGASNPNAFIDRFAEQVLHGSIAPATRATLLKQISDTPDAKPIATATAPVDANTTQRMAALLLGSPEFQRH